MQIEDKYILAFSRSDLSQWLVHFCKEVIVNNKKLDHFGSLLNILEADEIYASCSEPIRRYNTFGACCFYDIPLSNYHEVIKTNPSDRRGYGIIVDKIILWHLGGRPVIYTDNTTSINWPESERYRLVYTDLKKVPPVDWTHEREWRIQGNLKLMYFECNRSWWWPCVENEIDSKTIFKKFPNIDEVYVIELGKIVTKN
ncbi:hypothetical protein [Desulfopila aestuarii]|uniref:Uncharacterized protein n=1 Tax=Desulfopila aestuarii DSM 18488 TaxID=1121416 RepID=A0A1M7YBT9_9BACT|nr:hypothetical protein [Desulfopila aestuarii]SHO50083.1 hypothetical protein SAMN02745220_03241 [Desulfopila aestuarii DSM 18488]